MTIQKESVLAVIGGGRWGQVIFSILEKISLPFDRVVIVSRYNADEIADKIKGLKHPASIPFGLSHSIENLLNNYHVKAAIIANSARQHFETALHLIDHHIHVLIEKPIVLLTEQINMLIEKANEKSICLFPGLCYQFCSYLDNFAELISQNGSPAHFVMKWYDTANESRYGKLKKFDTTIDIAQDVMPHIWTILSKIFPHSVINIHACLNHNVTDDEASFRVSLNDMTGEIHLTRNATARERAILVEFNQHNFLKLDFSTEPGIIFSNSKTVSGDTAWDSRLSPLTKQLLHFFSYIEAGEIRKENLAACVNSVTFTETASHVLQKYKLN